MVSVHVTRTCHLQGDARATLLSEGAFVGVVPALRQLVSGVKT